MSVDVSQINTKLTPCSYLSGRYWCTAGSTRQRRANCGEETVCVVMTEISGLSPELRTYWSQLTWRDWDLQCWPVLSSFLFLQGSRKPCFHTIAEKKKTAIVAIIWKPFSTIVAIAATTIAESPISAGRYDRWRVVSIWSLRSPNFFFSAIKRKTRLSSKYAPRNCCATLVIFKAQYPVTAHVPNFDFLTGCREFRRCEESKRALKNPFASRLAEFDTTLKLPTITDQ